MNNYFVHLHVHDEYSLLDGYGKAKNYAKRAKELGFTYLASTNHGTIDGLIKFQKACESEGIIPILGCELYIVPDHKIKGKETRGHITVLCKNEKGFRNLCKMLTKANLEGFYYRPRIGFDDFYDLSSDLVILTGCALTFMRLPGGEELLRDLAKAQPDDLYLEVMPHDLKEQIDVNLTCLDIRKELGLSLVASNDCHYIDKEDWEVQEVLLAIQSKAKWDDPHRFKFTIKDLHLASELEMMKAFERQNILNDDEIDEALDATLEIAEKCSGFRIPKQDIFLPKVQAYADKPDSFLLDLAFKKLDEYLPEDVDDLTLNTYKFRLKDEWELIQSKNFVDYFNIVHELIGWCRKQGIMTGPGRGSVGGSLLAFLIGITNVDPIKYNLLFSRFIAVNRTDYPDIDVDFEDTKRDQVRAHLEELYGRENISSISTFLTMKGRAAVRDVARVFDVPLAETDAFAKAIENAAQAGNDEGIIEDAVNETQEGKEFARRYPKVVDMAIRLEGQIRGAGQHAAAIVVSADDLTQGKRGNLCRRSDQNVSNWDMSDSEYVGLMKLDVLGLNTLSILNETRRLLQIKGKEIIFEHIPLDDRKVFDELAQGHTVGVFQLNTYAGTKLSKAIEMDNFYQIADNLALVRPGPYQSGMTDEYVERHWGKKWDKKHDLYEEITKNTYGLIVYQEQIMEVIHKIAGLPYETADKIRKVIGKKRDAKEFEPYKISFYEGCHKMGYFDQEEAEWFWEMLQNHASYSFNLSHSVEYAMISYWTAYLKTYYPAQFICASLTYAADSKKEELIEEAKRLGLKIILPRVGKSDALKWMVEDKILYAPFIEVKGLGEKTAVQAAATKPKLDASVKGFFTGKVGTGKKTKMDKILEDIGAFGGTPTAPELQDYFDFDLLGIYSVTTKGYRNLYSLVGDRDIDLKSLLSLDFAGADRMGIIKQKSYTNRKLMDCVACSLSKECEFGPVLPLQGKYNIAIVGDSPDGTEDAAGKPLMGKDAEILWKALDKFDLTRDMFHVTQMVKCFPKVTRTPNDDQLKACSKWIHEEVESLQCRLILALGKTSLRGFKGEDSGIRDLTGKCEWVESIGAWVVWCMHPGAIKHHFQNEDIFYEGIKAFSDKIERLGGL